MDNTQKHLFPLLLCSMLVNVADEQASIHQHTHLGQQHAREDNQRLPTVTGGLKWLQGSLLVYVLFLFKPKERQTQLHFCDSPSLFLTRLTLRRESSYTVPAHLHNPPFQHYSSSEEAFRVTQVNSQRIKCWHPFLKFTESKYDLEDNHGHLSRITLINVSKIRFQNTARPSISMPFIARRTTTRNRNTANLSSLSRFFSAITTKLISREQAIFLQKNKFVFICVDNFFCVFRNPSPYSYAFMDLA